MRTNLSKSGGKWIVEVDPHEDEVKPFTQTFTSREAAEAFQHNPTPLKLKKDKAKAEAKPKALPNPSGGPQRGIGQTRLKLVKGGS